MAPVRNLGEESIVKSVGNSTTAVRDLENDEDVKLILYVLAESVAARLRKYGLKCTTVQIYIRDKELISFERQGKLVGPTFTSGDIVNKAMDLFISNYQWSKPIRSIGVRGANLVTANRHIQLDLFDTKKDVESIEKTIDKLRQRFGHYCIQRCAMMLDPKLTGFNPKDDHTIHPISYFK
jgi:DNA polymerase-4